MKKYCKILIAVTATLVSVFSAWAGGRSNAISSSAASGLFLYQASSIPGPELIQPEALVKILQTSTTKPLMIQVGSRVLYEQAHIPGSEYIGPASSAAGLEKLRQRLQSLPRGKSVILYCGCCPWSHCPNVKPAWDLAHSMGFSKLKVLYIADNFGADWVDKGYPTAKGQ